MSASPSYYDLLGIAKDATAEQIKSAYRGRAKAYHPDGNGGGGDPERFSRVNEAYEVLRDPERRAQYDASFYDLPADEARSKPVEPIRCSKCGKVAAQPRYAVYWTVVSALVATWRTPTQGIYCSACARKVALRCSTISAVAGWWGVWGLLWTPLAIVRNAMGGEQPAGSATRMLWFNALAFWSQGKLATAHALAKMVARSGSDLADDAVTMLKELQRAGVPADTRSFADVWRRSFGDLAAHGALLAIVPLIIASLVMADGGGQASSYQSSASPSVGDSPITVPSPSATVTPEVAAASPAPVPIPTCDHEVKDGTILKGRVLDKDFGHRLEIKNGASGPAIIKVRNAETGHVQVAFYVGKDGHADVGPLPDGTYRIQYATGDAMAANCKSFAHIQGASEFPGSDTFKIEQRGDQLVAQHLSYTLYSVPLGNVHPDTIDPAAFEVD